MLNLRQLAAAQHAVFIMFNPDGSDAEFLSLKPMASESDLRDLAARWSGRNFTDSGVAGIIRGIPTVMLKEEPSDFLLVVRLTAAYAQYVQDITAAVGSSEPELCKGDSVAWLERLYSLEDTRVQEETL
jgi:hypothetical protein